MIWAGFWILADSTQVLPPAGPGVGRKRVCLRCTQGGQACEALEEGVVCRRKHTGYVPAFLRPLLVGGVVAADAVCLGAVAGPAMMHKVLPSILSALLLLPLGGAVSPSTLATHLEPGEHLKQMVF